MTTTYTLTAAEAAVYDGRSDGDKADLRRSLAERFGRVGGPGAHGVEVVHPDGYVIEAYEGVDHDTAASSMKTTYRQITIVAATRRDLDAIAAAAAINRSLAGAGDSSWLIGDVASEHRCMHAAREEIASCHPSIRDALSIEIGSYDLDE